MSIRCWLGLLLGFACAASPARAGDSATLQFNESTATADVVMKGGHAYVPVTAVAKLLNATVQVEGDTYKFIPLDNSRQVNGAEGYIGDMVRLGYANVTVTDVFEGQQYKAKWGGNDATADAGKKLVVVTLHIQNSTLKTQLFNVLGGDRTALADKDGKSYAPSSFSDFRVRGQDLLPGAAVDLALIFNVESDVQIKDLVYEVGFSNVAKAKVARIHLTKPAAGQ